jgi:hypothetical protein
MKFGSADYSKPKSVLLKGEDMREVDSLLFSPLFQDRMPDNIKKMRSKMVLWAVRELERILRDGIKEQQMYLDFENKT